MQDFLIWGLVAFVLSLVVSGLCFWLFPKFGLMDKPHLYGHKRKPVPYSMGLPLFVVFLGVILFALQIDGDLVLLLTAVGLLVVVSFLDDYFDLSPVFRLLLQFLCAGLAVYSGAEVLEITNPFGAENFELGGLAFLFSVFWIVFLTNLLNFLDGVAGLSSGVSSIGFFVLFGLSVWPGVHLVDQTQVATMAVVLGAISLVGAIFEFPQPKFLVGDSGSMFFGFMLGTLSLINGGKLATVALVMLIPIFDGLWAIARRLYNKKSPMMGDLKHFHHRLLKLGFSPQVLVGAYYLGTFLFGLIALFAWNTFFKVLSLLILFSGFSVFAYLLWIHEKK